MQITAVPNSGFALRYWLGDFAGGTLQQSVTMDDQHDVTAYFGTPLAFSVLNAASFLGNPQFDNTGFAVTPGEIVTIFGSNLGPASLATAQLDANGNIATTLAGTRVLFDGVPSPMIYTSANQVSAVVPFAVTGKTSTVVRTEYNGVQSGGLQISAADSAPALFTANASGTGQIAALNQDYSINSPSQTRPSPTPWSYSMPPAAARGRSPSPTGRSRARTSSGRALPCSRASANSPRRSSTRVRLPAWSTARCKSTFCSPRN